ncbi:MAG: hypothetical protein HY097_09230, partial [Nitrospinae bacterium]|nr:hypothetical protein [Nitrospinota bacterium]
MQIVEERVSSLEETLERFILHVDRSFERQERFAKEMREDRKKAEERQERFAKEMREDRKKAEERQEKSAKEMCEDRKKAEERQEKSVKEMCEDRKKAEERQEKSAKEMKDFKDEMREARIKAFKLWGDAANRMGTLAEDIVAPSIREIGEKYFKLKDEDDFMVRRFKRKKADKSKRREFDVICVYEEAVILVEVKSTPRMQYIDDFIKALK